MGKISLKGFFLLKLGSFYQVNLTITTFNPCNYVQFHLLMYEESFCGVQVSKKMIYS